ncbi:MAG: 6-phosphogluconolactonase [Acidiferrobacterales bacterium]
MGTFTIKQFANGEQVSDAAAEAFVSFANEAIAARQRFTVALSGGSTPRRLYELLAESPFNTQVAWDKLEFFWGDERAVPPEHADSNYGMTSDALLTKLAIPEAHIHRMPADREDLENAAWDYQAEIARVFGVDPDGEPPQFDLVLLGMGADGHTASLFPYTEAIREETRWVVSSYVPKLDSYRLTLTPSILNKSAHVLFLVAGADKATPLEEVLEGPSDPERLPSQLIRPTSGDLTWLIDNSAATQLRRVNRESLAVSRK